MNLAQANSLQDVENACANTETGCYDVFHHMFLRNSYTFVYVTKDGMVRDTHRHYVQGGGHSEHSIFIKAVHTKNFTVKLPSGPSNSRAENRNAQRQSQRLQKH